MDRYRPRGRVDSDLGIEMGYGLKRIKYEIRLCESNGSMSMGQKKVEPILCVESLTKQMPKLVHHVSDS